VGQNKFLLSEDGFFDRGIGVIFGGSGQTLCSKMMFVDWFSAMLQHWATRIASRTRSIIFYFLKIIIFFTKFLQNKNKKRLNSNSAAGKKPLAPFAAEIHGTAPLKVRASASAAFRAMPDENRKDDTWTTTQTVKNPSSALKFVASIPKSRPSFHEKIPDHSAFHRRLHFGIRRFFPRQRL
jgi:hypothetical protein